MKTLRYTYLLVLQGDYGYGHGWEDLAAEDKGVAGARQRINQTRREYVNNEGGNYRVIERRELNTQEGAA
jgi:hypothetical protein